jgi:hypothetical protein
MGASFNWMDLPGNLTEAQVRDAFAKAQEQDRHDNGHSYSGGFGMADGLILQTLTFDTFKEAEQFLADTCQKWEKARAVKFKDKDGVVKHLIGAWCAS